MAVLWPALLGILVLSESNVRALQVLPENDIQDDTELKHSPTSFIKDYGSVHHLVRQDDLLDTFEFATDKKVNMQEAVTAYTEDMDDDDSLLEKEKRLYELTRAMPRDSSKLVEYDIVFVLRLMYECLGKHTKILLKLLREVYETIDFVYNRVGWIDCSDAMKEGYKSGYYTFFMKNDGKRPITLLCDMETDGGGWTVVQRRQRDGPKVIFNQGWYPYKIGFGNYTTEYWAGLQNMYVWCKTRNCEMRVDLQDTSGKRAYAYYSSFYLDSEVEGYKLNTDGYRGSAGNALEPQEGGRVQVFSTYDNLNKTNRFCARKMFSGWWFSECKPSINGIHVYGRLNPPGLAWHTWAKTLKTTEMKIRPTKQ